MRSMSKSAVRVAREALAVGRAALPAYGSPCSRHDYTQPQLFALLALKQFLGADYRGLVALVAEWRELRHALGLRKVPHYSTLAHAARRLLAGAEGGDLPPRPGRGDGPRPRSRPDRRRAGRGGGRHRARGPPRQRLLPDAPRRAEAPGAAQARLAEAHGGPPRPPAPSEAVLPTLGAVTGTGPTQDSPAFAPAMRQAAALLGLDTVLADAAYDAEHNHRLCREALGVRRSVIALNPRNTGRRWPKTPYRRALRRRFPKPLYNQRWHVEMVWLQMTNSA